MFGGEEILFEEKKGAKTCFRHIFPKTRPRYPVNFEGSFNFHHPSIVQCLYIMIVYVLLRNQMGNLVKGKYAVQHSDGGDIAVISKHNTDMFKHPDMYSHNQNNLQLVSEICLPIVNHMYRNWYHEKKNEFVLSALKSNYRVREMKSMQKISTGENLYE